MAANTSIILANPDFFSIKESLKYALKQQTAFKDYNFEGSNLNAILDILATNTYQSAFTKNMVASEMFISSAQLPTSIYSRAKELGYTPRSARSASALLQIEIIPQGSPSSIIIPKETIFTATVGARSLTFTTNKAYVLKRNSDSRYIGDIIVYEGLFLTDTFTADTNTKYIINNRAVDMDSLEVTSTNDSGSTLFKKIDNIINVVTATDPVFYTQINFRGLFEVYFGDNILGAKPDVGSTVNFRYRVTSAELGNNAGLFRASTSIAGYTNIKILTQTLSSGGANIENAEITRKYAPLANQIRDRAFTTEDYEILLRQTFPEIRSITVFGGEELNPPQYGKIAISIITDESFNGISSNLKQKYTTFIKSKNPTMITPIFLDPDLLQIKATSQIYFDYTLTTLTESDIIAKVKLVINNFDLIQLNDFNTILRKSKLTGAIDTSDTSINSNETKLELIVIIDQNLISSRAKSISIYNTIATCLSTDKPSIYSTAFKYDNKTCRLANDIDGVLYITTIVNNVSIKLKAIGSVDYINGNITINPIAIQELYTTNLKLYIKPENDDIVASLNTIIQLDSSELNITAQAQKR